MTRLKSPNPDCLWSGVMKVDNVTNTEDMFNVIEQLCAEDRKQASPAQSVLFPNRSSTLTNPQQEA